MTPALDGRVVVRPDRSGFGTARVDELDTLINALPAHLV
jgi:hypothetical protein